MASFHVNPQILTGRTIESVEVIPAEYGRTHNRYTCIVCTDGTRVIIGGGTTYNPQPPLKSMQEAPNFFTPEMIAARVLKDEQEKREHARRARIQRRRDYVMLQKEFG